MFSSKQINVSDSIALKFAVIPAKCISLCILPNSNGALIVCEPVNRRMHTFTFYGPC